MGVIEQEIDVRVGTAALRDKYHVRIKDNILCLGLIVDRYLTLNQLY